ncbi:MAG: CPBP family intramembrane metalloprotease [Myxococcales bacterium]|nr:CPBP family intramembrane metalloprotease [Myxococcales bacterium]
MDRRRRNLMALGFYGLLAASAVLWNWAAGRPMHALLYDPDRLTRAGLVWGLLSGLLLGAATVAFSRWTIERFGWGRDLYRFFARALGEVSWADAALLALTSSIGEELFFRGIMLPRWGIVWSTLLFMLSHPAPAKRLWPWTASAGVMGLLFALITQRSANLGGALVAHFVVNLFNLRHVSEFVDPADDLYEPPPDDDGEGSDGAADDDGDGLA